MPNSRQVFPIKTATACQLKWNWSTLYLYKSVTASCHRTGWGELTPDSFNNFHNTDKKIAERQLMLEGLWPEDSCGYCKSIEESGGVSDRMLHLQIPNQSPPELEADPTATVISPTILEVYFNNTCNLSCLYCIPDLSSKINQENKKFGNFSSNGVVLIPTEIDTEYSKILEKFWEWMEKNSKSLKRLNLLGGEPFYQDEVEKCLQYLEQSSHPNLELGIVTNLMVSTDRLQEYIDRFKQLLKHKKIKRIDLTCSIDCFGQEQEYVRYGLSLEQWMKNFQLVLEHRWLTVNINQTITLLTIKTMPSLLKQLSEWKKVRPVGHFFSVADPQPSYLHPGILGPNIFKDDFKNIVNLLSTATDQDKIALNYMQGIANDILKAEINKTEILKLKTFLDEKDRRRGTNWKQIFPWLETEININV